MIFVGGVHGVGKTTYCLELERETGKIKCTASELISKINKQWFDDKRTTNIEDNQRILIEEVKGLRQSIGEMILDGHLCLINHDGEIVRLPIEVFESLDIDEIIILVDTPTRIKKRLENRDSTIWDIGFINEFQNEEIRYAKVLANKLHLDLRIVTNKTETDESDQQFGKNILLPIKPVFAEEILCNRKKYEYRKKLCYENIDKIYLYATAPVKCILGEVEVLEKIIMKKCKLWELSKNESGISLEYYERYFRANEYGSAYHLGKVQRYENRVQLEEIGIKYYPQSYVYIDGSNK